MSRILCLDASTEACSVALLNQGEVTEMYQLAPRQHANLLLPSVDQLLADSQIKLNQLDAIACLVGPGAFTGIRIAVSVAQGLAYGANLPTIPVSSLSNLAQQAFIETANAYCWSAIDARMDEVYFGCFSKNADGIAEPMMEENVIAPQKIAFESLYADADDRGISLIGSGWAAYQNIFTQRGVAWNHLLSDRFPKASASLSDAAKRFAEGKGVSPEKLQPVYLRNKVAEKKAAKN
jgi:tRNA threonylcarbamoyladenosine biosynthesis protein TsaB